MPTTRRTVPTVGALAALVAIALVITLTLSCGGDDAPPDDPPPTTAPVTTTTTSVESEVEAAYTAYREMVTRLLQNPDPDDPEISQRATGGVRDQLRSSLRSLRDQGRAIRFGEYYSYDVLGVTVRDGGAATVKACLVDDGETIDVASGDVISGGTATGIITVSLELVDGSWLVSLTPEPEFIDEGVASCE